MCLCIFLNFFFTVKNKKSQLFGFEKKKKFKSYLDIKKNQSKRRIEHEFFVLNWIWCEKKNHQRNDVCLIVDVVEANLTLNWSIWEEQFYPCPPIL